MAGMAGVTMVMSREDRRTDRQRGVMISTILVPEGRPDDGSRDSAGSDSTERGDIELLAAVEMSTSSAMLGPSSVGKRVLLLSAVIGLYLSRPIDAFAPATVEVGVDEATTAAEDVVAFGCRDMALRRGNSGRKTPIDE